MHAACEQHITQTIIRTGEQFVSVEHAAQSSDTSRVLKHRTGLLATVLSQVEESVGSSIEDVLLVLALFQQRRQTLQTEQCDKVSN